VPIEKSISNRVWVFVSSFLYLLIIFARDWKAINRIGADTGYTYVPDAVNGNLSVLLKPFPEYFEISGRATAEIVALFPIRYHAIASSSVVNLIWVALALFIFAMIYQETDNRVLASGAGLVLIVVPHAMESSLGNIGMIKFPLTAAVAIAFCSSRAIIKYSKLITILALLAGLSQPILFVIALPLIWFFRSQDRDLRRKVTTLLTVVFGALIIQVLKVGVSAAARGRSGSRVMSLWPGMGLFWYSGIFFPILFCLIIIIVNSLSPFRNSNYNELRFMLCASTIALSASSYILGGIADRYFVAPMTLAWICGLLLLHDFIIVFNKLKIYALAISLIFVVVPVAKWFEAGWFLTTGPTWTSEVDRGREICATQLESEIELFVSPNSSAIVECSQLIKK
jgi:hypothetical protein